MRFEGISMGWSVDGWHYVDAQGNYAQTKYPQRAGPDDLFFTVHTIAGKSIATFDRSLPAERRAQIERARPAWLHAILYTAPAEFQMRPVGKILVEIGYVDGVGPEACAFVAAMVHYGDFDDVPAIFFVDVWGHGTYEVTLAFSGEADSWSGDVIVQSTLDDE